MPAASTCFNLPPPAWRTALGQATALATIAPAAPAAAAAVATLPLPLRCCAHCSSCCCLRQPAASACLMPCRFSSRVRTQPRRGTHRKMARKRCAMRRAEYWRVRRHNNGRHAKNNTPRIAGVVTWKSGFAQGATRRFQRHPLALHAELLVRRLEWTEWAWMERNGAVNIKRAPRALTTNGGVL